MPRGVGLIIIKEIVKLLYDLISEIFIQAASDSSNTFGGSPPDCTVIVLQEVQQVLNDEF